MRRKILLFCSILFFAHFSFVLAVQFDDFADRIVNIIKERHVPYDTMDLLFNRMFSQYPQHLDSLNLLWNKIQDRFVVYQGDVTVHRSLKLSSDSLLGRSDCIDSFESGVTLPHGCETIDVITLNFDDPLWKGYLENTFSLDQHSEPFLLGCVVDNSSNISAYALGSSDHVPVAFLGNSKDGLLSLRNGETVSIRLSLWPYITENRGIGDCEVLWTHISIVSSYGK